MTRWGGGCPEFQEFPHCLVLISPPPLQVPSFTSLLWLYFDISCILLSCRHCVSSFLGSGAPSPFFCSAYPRLLLRRDSKWRSSPSGRHQLHAPQGALLSSLCDPLWPRRFSPPRPRAIPEAGGGRVRRAHDRGHRRSSSRSAPHPARAHKSRLQFARSPRGARGSD
ncbi:hypothetical protein NDU88_005829 [Pleurodeles waltl]|uniref:Uncharacterized protein n=1 Tax=Pleurodeles waltl TaxID=8319 RepID=A0AAV7PJQ1_PLEWA|nr:hypothetical protein NDU88_005829 [Pleurodeles waltl]